MTCCQPSKSSKAMVFCDRFHECTFRPRSVVGSKRAQTNPTGSRQSPFGRNSPWDGCLPHRELRCCTKACYHAVACQFLFWMTAERLQHWCNGQNGAETKEVQRPKRCRDQRGADTEEVQRPKRCRGQQCSS